MKLRATSAEVTSPACEFLAWFPRLPFAALAAACAVLVLTAYSGTASANSGSLSAGPGYACMINADTSVSCVGSQNVFKGSTKGARWSSSPETILGGAKGASYLWGKCAIVGTAPRCERDDYGTIVTTPALTSILNSNPGPLSSFGIGSFGICGTFGGALKCWDSSQTEPRVVDYPVLPSGARNFSDGCMIVQTQVWCQGATASAMSVDSNGVRHLEGDVFTVAGSGGSTDFALEGMYSGALGCSVIGGGVSCWTFSFDSFPALSTSVLQPMPGLRSGVTQISIGAGASGVNGPIHSGCAVQNGGVKCWGDNSRGQLGREFPGARSDVPVRIAGAESGATDVVGGGAFACARVNGKLKCWGGVPLITATNKSGVLGRSIPLKCSGGAGCLVRIRARVGKKWLRGAPTVAFPAKNPFSYDYALPGLKAKIRVPTRLMHAIRATVRKTGSTKVELKLTPVGYFDSGKPFRYKLKMP